MEKVKRDFHNYFKYFRLLVLERTPFVRTCRKHAHKQNISFKKRQYVDLLLKVSTAQIYYCTADSHAGELSAEYTEARVRI